MRNGALSHIRTTKTQIRLRRRSLIPAQSDQGLRCPLLESADRVKCIDEHEMFLLDCAHAQAYLGVRYAHMAY